jgi:hypothetical protein
MHWLEIAEDAGSSDGFERSETHQWLPTPAMGFAAAQPIYALVVFFPNQLQEPPHQCDGAMPQHVGFLGGQQYLLNRDCE